MATAKKIKTIRCAILGASGYAGMELVRILSAHPNAEITCLTSDSYAGKRVREIFPWTPVPRDCKYAAHSRGLAADADVYFVAFPHGKAHPCVLKLLKKGRVIDISADFRLKNPADYDAWYGFTHPEPGMLKKAVYGLPELRRDAVKKARLVANPGCYPTSVILGLMPLARFADAIGGPIIVDAKSGYSGAGRSLKTHLLFTEATAEFTAYKILRHNHIAEMRQELEGVFGRDAGLCFTPHLIPAARGILSTIYVPLTKSISEKQLRAAYAAACEGEPFLRLCEPGAVPSIKQVAGTNLCLVNAWLDADNGLVKVVSAIDNLVKGAAGQAVQNMNLMFGFEETAGLCAAPLAP